MQVSVGWLAGCAHTYGTIEDAPKRFQFASMGFSLLRHTVSERADAAVAAVADVQVAAAAATAASHAHVKPHRAKIIII